LQKELKNRERDIEPNTTDIPYTIDNVHKNHNL
jgi:hypothetical protein